MGIGLSSFWYRVWAVIFVVVLCAMLPESRSVHVPLVGQPGRGRDDGWRSRSLHKPLVPSELRCWGRASREGQQDHHHHQAKDSARRRGIIVFWLDVCVICQLMSLMLVVFAVLPQKSTVLPREWGYIMQCYCGFRFYGTVAGWGQQLLYYCRNCDRCRDSDVVWIIIHMVFFSLSLNVHMPHVCVMHMHCTLASPLSLVAALFNMWVFSANFLMRVDGMTMGPGWMSWRSASNRWGWGGEGLLFTHYLGTPSSECETTCSKCFCRPVSS